MTDTRIIIIGRHNLTDRQKKILEKAFGSYTITGKIHTVNPDDKAVIEQLKKADAIIIQTLPIDVLAKLKELLGNKLYIFKILPIGVVSSDEALNIAKEGGCDIVNIDPRTGNARVSITVGLDRITEVVYKTKRVVTLE